MNKPNKEKKQHWAQISEAGTVLGMRILLHIYRLGGKPLFKIFLAPVILYFFLFRSDSRQASFSYLKRLRNIKPELKQDSLWKLSLRHFWQFGLSIIDSLTIWSGAMNNRDLIFHQDEIVSDLLAKKRGAILLISHLGNVEICRALSVSHPELRLTVLIHNKNAKKFNQLLKESDNDSSTEILQVTDISPATAMQLNERLERGEFIAISGDRVSVNNPNNTLSVNFLGDTALLPNGPFALAAILKAPLISLFCLREHQRYHIYFDYLSQQVNANRKERPLVLQQLASDYAKKLQHYCLQAPLQWFNFFDFWANPLNSAKHDTPTTPSLSGDTHEC